MKVYILTNGNQLYLNTNSTLKKAKEAVYLLECNRICRGYCDVSDITPMFWVGGYHQWTAYEEGTEKCEVGNSYKGLPRYMIFEIDLQDEGKYGHFAQADWMKETAQELGLPTQSKLFDEPTMNMIDVEESLIPKDLITITRAAKILRGAANNRDLVSIYGYIKRGRLTVYRDFNASNPQHAQRVSSDEVERLKTKRDKKWRES